VNEAMTGGGGIVTSKVSVSGPKRKSEPPYHSTAGGHQEKEMTRQGFSAPALLTKGAKHSRPMRIAVESLSLVLQMEIQDGGWICGGEE
jgi:hypothetical protein